MTECENCGAEDLDACGCESNTVSTKELAVTEETASPTSIGLTYNSVQLQPGPVQSERPINATPPGIRPPRRFTAAELGLPTTVADAGAVDREIRERLARTADVQERRRQEAEAARAARPTVDQQIALVIRRVATLEAQRVEDRVRIVSLEEVLAAMKPATVSRIGRASMPGSAA